VIVDVDQIEALPERARYDVCIVGGGVAGIVLATTLARRRRRVLLLEAGGLEYSDRSQQVYAGEIVGRDYLDLAVARLRYLGGSSNHWDGLCRPLEPHDFDPRPHVEGSGWPIGSAELEPYLIPACEILEIDSVFGERELGAEDADLKEVTFRQSPPVRLLDKYLRSMRASGLLDVYLNANVTGLRFDSGNGRVGAALFRGYDDQRPVHHIAADRYVLALGGIENARLLLNVADGSPFAGGGAGDFVGRFFMDHPHFVIGHYVVNRSRTSLGRELQFVAPTAAYLQRQQIGNCAVRIEPFVDRRVFEGDALDEVRRLVCESTVFRCTEPSEAGTLRAVAEPVPDASSRLRLSDDKDAFGLRRVALDWRLSPLDKKTMRIVGLELGRYLALTNIGRIRLADWVVSNDDVMPDLEDGGQGTGYHHMGTTRMGRSAHDGVVDRNCAVFGVPNLYVAGSSVFRTVGYANPTLTIVQLALRLADHLAPA
jgi:choline dehydrogenase-like flavoprotein